MDANTLLENHTVEEVREIEKKVRHDIEWKKEEMRDLVGERYRDLISAADTIKQMKICSEKIGEKLTTINKQCERLHPSKPDKSSDMELQGKVLRSGSEQKAVYEIACEIKLLLAVPGKIWSYLDNAAYLPAAKLYLLSKHVHTCLQYDTQTGGQVLGRFPVIAKQWSAISHFQSAILQGCRRVLADYTETSSNIVDAACSILLLEGKTPRQVFQDFLIARMYTGRGVTGVRNHIHNAIHLIHNTIYQLTAVFCDSQPSELGKSNTLANSLSDLLQHPLLDQKGLSEFASLSMHLPKSVTTYKPSLRVQNVSLTEDYLKTNCDKWIRSCLDNVRKNIKEQLGYVTTIKSMTALRELVWKTYTEDERMECWIKVCEPLFSRPINLWIDELSPLFTARVQEIIKEHFASILTSTESQLKAASDLILLRKDATSDASRVSLQRETDITSFIWCESANDIPSMEMWVNSAQKSFEHGGGLLMKAHSFTPIVQNLCSRLNQSLGALLSEIETYRQTHEVAQHVELLLSDQQSISSSAADYLSKESYDAVCRLSELVRKELDSSNLESLSSSGKKDEKFTMQHCRWILLLARFCVAVPKLCPKLEKCVLLQSTSQMDNSMNKPMTMSMSRSFSKQPCVNPVWSGTVDILTETSLCCYRVWITHTVHTISEELSSKLSLDDLTSVLCNVTRWDDVEIEEDAEDGKSVKSVISVPMQITWCLQRALSQLCRDINSVGSHSIPRNLQMELVSGVLLRLLNIYKRNIEKKEQLTQAVALQYLFDVWYLYGLLLWRDSDKATEIEKLYSWLVKELQAMVDPFDLDVFTPHMQKHVAKQKSRNLVLFGAIADADKVMSMAGRQSSAGKPEQHNVLPLHMISNTRFPLLPVISESSRSQTLVGKTVNKQGASVHKEVSNLAKVQSEPALKMSSSFYDRIGSGAMSWFTGGASGKK
ncbi:conserved oligomeric Golgi complex subunit 1-like [Watersipora subatra]|uniref:conserved oligomeric Golgi complex subunit 1-like n=1 Tax=Watersipora subatra TaxID=2589382 RepID=UPI00355C4859